MAASLHPCPECARHILSSEVSCPFCAASVADAMSLLSAAPKRAGAGRMGRAALVALGTLAASPAVAACGGNAEDSGEDSGDGDGDSSGDGDGDSSGDGDGDGDMYGTGGDMNNGTGGNNDVAVYGAPPTGGADNLGTGGEDNLGTGGADNLGTGGDQIGPVYGIPPDPPN